MFKVEFLLLAIGSFPTTWRIKNGWHNGYIAKLLFLKFGTLTHVSF